jgi:hypothetical protein
MTESPGVNVTITHNSTGQWTFNATGLGNGCPLPALTSASPAVTYITSGTCGGGSVSIGVASNDGQDDAWSFTIVGVQTGATGATAASASTHRITIGR